VGVLVHPILQLPHTVDEEDASALRASRRLHDPGCILRLFVLLLKNPEVVRQHPSHGDYIHEHKLAVIVAVRDRVAFSLHLPPETLDILHH